MKRLTSLLLVLFAVECATLVPAAKADAPLTLGVRVFVNNAATGEPLFGYAVSLYEAPADCNGWRGGTLRRTTIREGIADFSFLGCTGAWTVTVDGGPDFDTQQQELQLKPGFTGYNMFFKLQPKGRVLNIRVQGRAPDGTLLPVPSAVIYDQSGNQIATTDGSGHATARMKEAMGETVYLRAQAPDFKPGSASYVVGASEGGTRITRSDDYVNFVLGETQTSKQEIDLSINVQGIKDGKKAPIQHALIYDEEGHYLASTDARGHAAATVEVALGETFRLKADAHLWKAETLSLLARSETKSLHAGSPGNPRLIQHVRFVLQPATNEVGDLIVEVLDRNTDKPVPGAAVRLYKPTGFPGKLVGFETTDHLGQATFDAVHVKSALSGEEARVGVKHGGYLDAVQTVARSLTTAEQPKYVVYLKPNTEQTKWSGTYTEGPYTIQISGGNGSLGFTTLRAQGIGTCCPLTDEGSGNCEVIGNKATCQWHAHYKDSAKDVVRSGHGTLTYQGDSIQYDMLQVTGTITLTTGTCPAIEQCTGMHPGAEFTGTWTRKKQ